VRLQLEEEALQTAQSVRHGGLFARNPDCVGDEDRIGLQVAPVMFDEVFEVRRADLLLKLPDEFEI
jgi:hypothetical protein